MKKRIVVGLLGAMLLQAQYFPPLGAGSGSVGGAAALLTENRIALVSNVPGSLTQSSFLVSDVARLSQAQTFTQSQTIQGGELIRAWSILQTHAGATSQAHFKAENAIGAGTYLRTLGTGFTTSGAFKQDGGMLHTQSGLSGGLSIAAEAGDMRFYNGGTADANLLGGLFGSSWCLGPENAACSGTLEVQSGVPTTGNTVITFALGAGDALTSNIFTVAGKMTASGGIVLPAACTGLSAGVLYNNAGTPAICP